MKNKINLILFVLLIIIITSCKNTSNKTNDIKFTYLVDTLYYQDGLDLRKSSGSINSLDIKIIDDSVLLAVKSLVSDTIYYFSYNDKIKFKKKYCLSYDYSDSSKYGKIKSISIINQDSILILQEKRISIFSTVLLKSVNEFIGNDYWLNVCISNPILWDKSNKLIYNELIRYDVPEKNGISQTELISSIDIQKNKQIALPIYYNPKIDIKNNQNLFMSFTLIESEKIISGFSTISEAYVYDLKTKSVNSINLKSINEKENIKSDIKNEGYDSSREAFIKSFLYSNFFYDTEKQILFRSYIMDAISKSGELKKTISDKNFGCVAFNKKFEPIGEIVIKDIKSMPMMWFANNGYIYVQLNADLRKNYLRILKIKYEI